MGVSHSLLWQVVPLGMPVAKLGELMNESPPYVDPDAGLEGTTPFYPACFRNTKRCAGLPGLSQDREFEPGAEHPRLWNFVWALVK